MSSSLSPSPFLSPPSLLSSPFSVLPPELTQLIIEQTVPSSFQTSTYKSRQSTLRALCLVSKCFHHFARPLLLATLWSKSLSDSIGWEQVHAKDNDKLLCKEMILDGIKGQLSSEVEIAEYAGLRTLVINGSIRTALNLSILGHLPHVSVLRLCRVALSASTTVSLPNLHEMTLHQIEFTANQASILNSSTLPSLRLFAYYDEEGLLPSIMQALDLLLPQLYAVSLDYNLIKLLSPDLLSKLDPITLFDATIAELQDAGEKIEILHLRIDDFFASPGRYEEVKQLLLRARVSLPLTIFFPLSASPVGDALDRLVLSQVCAGRGIEVVYEDSPVLWYLNSGFSEYFIERMRKERRKEQETV